MIPNSNSGFTMLELLLVLGIFAVLAAVAAFQLANFQRGAKLESASKDIVGTLRLAHDRAVLGEDGNTDGSGDAWGIRFANAASDTYQTFFGSTYSSGNVKETVFLPSGVSFTAPTEGFNADVVFAKLIGTTTLQFIVSVADDTTTKTITTDTTGRVSSD